MGIRLIALDLDGTTLNDDQISVSEKNLAAIAQAIAKGVLVVPATGRSLNDIPKVVRRIEGLHYAITSNGACVVNLKENKIIYENTLTPDAAVRLLELLEPYPVYMEIFCEGLSYARRRDIPKLFRLFRFVKAGYFVVKRKWVGSLAELIRKKAVPLEKIELFAGSKARQEELFECLRQQPYPVTTSGMNTVEISNKGVNKREALLHLCEALGIDRSEVMAIGDNINDREMLEWAGVSVAVENAEPEIRQLADFVTRPSNQNGVAEAIEKLVL